MARLSDESDEGISLFPMFNILACTLGVMVFILATVSTVSLGANKAVEIVTSDSPDDPEARQPVWLTWDGTELELLPTGAVATFERDLSELPTWESTYAYISSVLSGSRLGSTIADIGLAPERRYIVLLVRPSGFDTLLEIKSYVEFLGIDVGYEPIDQQWQRLAVR